MKYFLLAISMLFVLISCENNNSQNKTSKSVNKVDSLVVKKIYNTALGQGNSYQWLDELANGIGGRLSGSPEAQKAVEWGEKTLNSIGLDSVWLQPVMVPHWVRGEKETAHFTINGKNQNVPICALGGSIPTSKNGVEAEVIEVLSLDAAEQLGEKLRDKIVFFNGKFSDTLYNTFKAYGGCVGMRVNGAKITGKYGAKGVIVRSMTHSIDDYPHTGVMSYGDIEDTYKIPAAAISTNAANALSEALKTNPNLKFYFKQSCENLPDAPSFNVIGELKGSEFPDKYITIGGHLDSWDIGDGAHDDGAGVVQSMEVLRIMKMNNIKPRYTLRVVLFMNEENGLAGGKKYAEVVKENNEIHIAALESDSGGFTPRGFHFEISDEKKKDALLSWKPLLEPYGLHVFLPSFSGADIRPLKNDKISLFGYKPDSQRYFDHHHAATDVFEAVNKRELELGAASMTSLVYLVDKYFE